MSLCVSPILREQVATASVSEIFTGAHISTTFLNTPSLWIIGVATAPTVSVGVQCASFGLTEVTSAHTSVVEEVATAYGSVSDCGLHHRNALKETPWAGQGRKSLIERLARAPAIAGIRRIP